MKFKSRKDSFFTVITLGLSLFFIGMAMLGIVNGRMADLYYWPVLVIFAVVALLLSLFFGTAYQLTPTMFYYKSGPFKGRIELTRIRKIEKGKTMYVGLKAATARKGLIISYDKYETLYISPDSNDSFLEELRKYHTAFELIA